MIKRRGKDGGKNCETRLNHMREQCAVLMSLGTLKRALYLVGRLATSILFFYDLLLIAHHLMSCLFDDFAMI